jgi:hypothetical protein
MKYGCPICLGEKIQKANPVREYIADKSFKYKYPNLSCIGQKPIPVGPKKRSTQIYREEIAREPMTYNIQEDIEREPIIEREPMNHIIERIEL